MSGNLPLFRKAAHGAAVAVVGSHGHVTTGTVDPCFKFVAKYAGVVWVGVNDREFGDNTGVAEITVMKRGATTAQWSNPGASLRCE